MPQARLIVEAKYQGPRLELVLPHFCLAYLRMLPFGSSSRPEEHSMGVRNSLAAIFIGIHDPPRISTHSRTMANARALNKPPSAIYLRMGVLRDLHDKQRRPFMADMCIRLGSSPPRPTQCRARGVPRSRRGSVMGRPR